MLETTLEAIRKPTRKEKKENGAEVVFVRRDQYGRRHKVFAAECYESWEQWGAIQDVLWDNMPAVEHWRRYGLEDCPNAFE